MSLTRRIAQLEHRRCSAESEIQYFVMNAGATFPLPLDECFAILDETGFVRQAKGIRVFDFLDIPHGLNARDLTNHIRDRAYEICNIGGADEGHRT